MQQLKDHFQNILDNGNEKPGRSGEFDTPDSSLSLFGAQLRFDLSNGDLPATTSKKLHFLPMLQEITWMIRGETNTQTLGNNIWDKWALDKDLVIRQERSEAELIMDLSKIRPGKKPGELSAELLGMLKKYITIDEDAVVSVVTEGVQTTTPLTMDMITPANLGTKGINIDIDGFHAELKELGIEGYNIHPQYLKGDCGPIYGSQWRGYESIVTRNGQRFVNVVDQLVKASIMLKEEPYSRRNLVLAWNPGLVPESDKTVDQNIALGFMGLPPCHFGLQLNVAGRENKVLSGLLKLRSSDTGVGLPFNIAAYSVIVAMYAAEHEMALGELIVHIGDAHVYRSHMEGVKEYIASPTHPLPKFELAANWPTIRKAIVHRGIKDYIDSLGINDPDEYNKEFAKEFARFYGENDAQTPEQKAASFVIVLNNICAEDLLPFITGYKSEKFIKLDLHD